MEYIYLSNETEWDVLKTGYAIYFTKCNVNLLQKNKDNSCALNSVKKLNNLINIMVTCYYEDCDVWKSIVIFWFMFRDKYSTSIFTRYKYELKNKFKKGKVFIGAVEK